MKPGAYPYGPLDARKSHPLPNFCTDPDNANRLETDDGRR